VTQLEHDVDLVDGLLAVFRLAGGDELGSELATRRPFTTSLHFAEATPGEYRQQQPVHQQRLRHQQLFTGQ